MYAVVVPDYVTLNYDCIISNLLYGTDEWYNRSN